MRHCFFAAGSGARPGLAAGFTLIEMLVAIGLLAVVSALAFRGLDQTVAAERRLTAEYRTWRAIEVATTLMLDDLRLGAPRHVRVAGAVQPALILQGEPDPEDRYAAQLLFSRRAPLDQEDVLGLRTRRIGYRFSGGRLVRLEWSAIDRPAASAPEAELPLLDGLHGFRVRVLDADGRWHDSWPPAGSTDLLPRAVEVNVFLAPDVAVQRIAVIPSAFWSN